jgi:hypothetical protein
MKRFIFALVTIMAMAIINIPAFAADVGVSVSIGQPGFYGRIDIGDAPRPEYINPQPIVIVPVPRGKTVEPIYLRVPPGHQKNWKKHCREYNACGQPVYFVKDNWYNDVYAPHYNKKHGNKHDDDRGKGHKDKGNKKDKHKGNDRD